MAHWITKTIITTCIVLISNGINSQTSKLTLDKIMAGNEFIGHQPSNFVWGHNGETIYFKWNPTNENIATYHSYNLKEKTIEKVQFDQAFPMALRGYIQNEDKSAVYYQFEQSIYEIRDKKTKQIYRNLEPFELLKVENNKIYILQNNNVFTLKTESGEFLQLTYFVEGTSPSTSQKSEFEKEQYALFQTLKENAETRESQQKYDKIQKEKFLHPFYLDGWNLDDLNMSEDQKNLVFIRSKYPSAKSTEYMKYVSEDGYSRAVKARSKVGESPSQHELYIWNLELDSVILVETSHLKDLNRIPDFYNDYPDQYPKSYIKSLIYHLHGINESNTNALVEIKSQDNKDRWLGFVNLKSGKFTEFNHQHNEAWIGGPGISGWNSFPGNVGWIDTETVYFQDEKTGYSHLYIYNNKTGLTHQITEGNYEIYGAELAHDKKSFYITANKNHPGNREYYRLNIENKKMIPLLTTDGNHEVLLSPDEKYFLINYSSKNKPWELYIAPNQENAAMEQITKSQSPEFSAYAWREPAVITYKASDNTPINARLYKPEAATKNGAAILFVHGAGYLQNAHNWWSGYYREYMFHNLLCDLGYTVLDVDYRASEGYGRDFRTAIYREMGGKDLSDFVDARTFLINEHGIDSNRVGIYGGSYGGFITLMALLTEPGKFRCGAAIRSVTDWSHYNHAYTSNILNSPDVDPIAFKRSSPIYFAENLSDKLLMLHGMVDDNVQYQDVVRLSQRFIELRKQNWDLVGYPVEPHGFKETSSWIDEYTRILNLFNSELLKH